MADAERREVGLELEARDAAPIPLDAALACAPGELLALVGPSGAGKTTLLRVAAGLYRPKVGVVRCAGATWFDADNGVFTPPHRRKIGFVFQSYALFPHMSANQNVQAAMRGADRRARAAALLARLRLGGLDDRKPHQLSGGQKQRVAMARALARDPAALLLDEPFAAVDQVTRRRLHLELADLRRSLAMPVVLVTHDLDEAAALADRMTLLHKGAVVQSGRPAEVLTKPASALAARLVAMPNLFEAEIADQKPERTLIRWRGTLLETAPRPEWPVGAAIAWSVPATALILHRRDRPSRGERENPVAGVIASRIDLGDRCALELTPDHGGPPLRFELSTHVAERNGVRPGVAATLSILSDAIHLIAPEAERAP